MKNQKVPMIDYINGYSSGVILAYEAIGLVACSVNTINAYIEKSVPEGDREPWQQLIDRMPQFFAARSEGFKNFVSTDIPNGYPLWAKPIMTKKWFQVFNAEYTKTHWNGQSGINIYHKPQKGNRKYAMLRVGEDSPYWRVVTINHPQTGQQEVVVTNVSLRIGSGGGDYYVYTRYTDERPKEAYLDLIAEGDSLTLLWGTDRRRVRIYSGGPRSQDQIFLKGEDSRKVRPSRRWLPREDSAIKGQEHLPDPI